MKKKIAIIPAAILLPCMFLFALGLLSLIPGRHQDDAFDENTAGIVDVILRKREYDSLQHYAIGPGQTTKAIDAFKSDPLQFFHLQEEYDAVFGDAGHTDFRLTDRWLEDESGSRVEITPKIQRVLDLAVQNEHDILKTSILQAGEQLFAAVELNVNLWCPCELYYYDEENDALALLVTFDSADYIGLRIRNMENVRAD